MTAASATQVSLSWAAPAGGAQHYEVERGPRLSGPFAVVETTAGTTFTDTAVAGGAAYLYRVRAVGKRRPTLRGEQRGAGGGLHLRGRPPGGGRDGRQGAAPRRAAAGREPSG